MRRYFIYLAGLVVTLLFVLPQTTDAKWAVMGGNYPWLFDGPIICRDGISMKFASAVENGGHIRMWQGVQYIPFGIGNAPPYPQDSQVINNVVTLQPVTPFIEGTITYSLVGSAIFRWSKPIDLNLPVIVAVYGGLAGEDTDLGEQVINPNCSFFGNANAKTFDPGDDRINRDPWVSAVVYCEDDQVKVYGVDGNSRGFFSFAVTNEHLDELGSVNENTLVEHGPSAFGDDIRLYKLVGDRLQINAPGLPPESWKEYVFNWDSC